MTAQEQRGRSPFASPLTWTTLFQSLPQRFSRTTMQIIRKATRSTSSPKRPATPAPQEKPRLSAVVASPSAQKSQRTQKRRRAVTVLDKGQTATKGKEVKQAREARTPPTASWLSMQPKARRQRPERQEAQEELRRQTLVALSNQSPPLEATEYTTSPSGFLVFADPHPSHEGISVDSSEEREDRDEFIGIRQPRIEQSLPRRPVFDFGDSSSSESSASESEESENLEKPAPLIRRTAFRAQPETVRDAEAEQPKEERQLFPQRRAWTPTRPRNPEGSVQPTREEKNKDI